MEPLKSKDKRAGIRIPLLSEKAHLHLEGNELEVDIGDITADGLFVRTEKLVAPRTRVSLKLTLPGDLGTLQVNGEVVRVNWAVNHKKGRENLGMGIRFDEITPNIQKILDAFVVYLRNKQIITVSKRIIEEFFGDNNGPKKFI